MATHRRPTDRAHDSQPGPHNTGDVEEVPLLLQRNQVNALIEAAQPQGLTAASLVRCLIDDYLRRTRGISP
jgi:hypothetical protein